MERVASHTGLPPGTRASGVLLHPTSLPGRGIGEMGAATRRWLDWLAGAGQSYWQVLPLVPVTRGGSPYNGLSAFAGNPLLVDSDALHAEGLVARADLDGYDLPADHVDFPRLFAWKERLLRTAHDAFRAGAAPGLRADFDEFRARSADWLDDYALFQAAREHHEGAGWIQWVPELRDREAGALRRWRARLAREIEYHAFAQFLFERQWQETRAEAREHGVRIIGDIPIFVDHDSADVWANRHLFHLDDGGRPLAVSGVPPDYFSETGQLWGNPLYDWKRMAQDGFGWWTARFRRIFEQVDVARIDHFRGFQAYWEVPAAARSAVDGRWVAGPGAALFGAVERALGALPLIAEDLGLITAEVDELRDVLGLPGMRVLQFAFDGDPRNPHLPENYPRNAVSYTGTHDNDTALGWWRHADAAERARVLPRLRPGESEGEIHWALMRLAFESVAQLSIAPLQDVLGLGSEARMNRPGLGGGNWQWRCAPEMLDDEPRDRLRALTRASGRLCAAPASADPSQPVRELT